MRKGVADNTLRALVSQDVNDRFADHIATMRCDFPLRNILQNVTSRKRKRGRSVRALEPTGKDLALLPNSLDAAVTALNFHDIYNGGGKEAADRFLKAAFAVLRHPRRVTPT